MGAYDPDNRRVQLGEEDRSPSPFADDGGGGFAGAGGMADLADRLAGFGLRGVQNGGVEASEAIAKKKEMHFLNMELQREEGGTVRTSDVLSDADSTKTFRRHSKVSPGNSPGDSTIDIHGMLTNHQNDIAGRGVLPVRTSRIDQQNNESSNINRALRRNSGVHPGTDSAGPSQLSTPTSISLSPNMHGKEGEYDPRFNLSGHGIVPFPGSNPNLLLKQELLYKVREQEEEIAQIRKHLGEYSMKEAQIRNETSFLEKRVGSIRNAFEQQQKDFVDAASKAVLHREEVMEENIRLTSALKEAREDRFTFLASLLPLLSDNHLEPPVHDAQSIVRNLKVLFRHLDGKLVEERLKKSQYQSAPWHAESSNNAGNPPQFPQSLTAPLAESTKHDWEITRNQRNRAVPSAAPKNVDPDYLGEKSSLVNKSFDSHNTSDRVNQSHYHNNHINYESKRQDLSFKQLVNGSKADDSETSMLQQASEPSVQWVPGRSSYSAGQDDRNPYNYLPPVLEEPGSSFSEAADDDPLPAIDEFRISGEAFPGRELQASGYSVNGTSSCNFEWVRHLEDGSVNYIEEAKQPNYLVTADDVDSYLAIEVQPLDDRMRKGELVKYFANEQRKITCDPETHEQIMRTRLAGHASFEVSLSAKFLDIWEPALLVIKREGYSIKCYGPRGVVATKKFKPATSATGYHRSYNEIIQNDGYREEKEQEERSFLQVVALRNQSQNCKDIFDMRTSLISQIFWPFFLILTRMRSIIYQPTVECIASSAFSTLYFHFDLV